MDAKKIFDKYYSRLAMEGVLKALIIGIISGFAIMAALSIVAFCVEALIWLWWVGLIVGIGICAVVTAVLYFLVFKPNTKEIAKRIDKLGLEERLITMTELENDDSYIAMRQREDAKAKLHELNTKSIKFSIAKSLIAIAAGIGLLGVSMTTVAALADGGVIVPPDGGKEDDPDYDLVMVIYEVDGEGYIEGVTEQLVTRGENTTPVYAVAAEGYAFVGWSDGIAEAERYEYAPEYDMFVFAMFIEVEISFDEGIEGEGWNGNFDDTVLPAHPQRNPNSERDDPVVWDPRHEPGDYGNDANQIINGKTSYQDVFDQYYEDAMKDLLENPNYTDEERQQIEAYFESLKSGSGLTDEKKENNE